MSAVDEYLKKLPADRRGALSSVRDVVNQHLPAGYVEDFGYGMITWSIPLSRYPDTYNGQPLTIAALAAQKNHSALYLMGIYGDADGATRAWFESEWQKSGKKKLDMGKSCVRFQRADDLALDVVAKAIALVSVADYVAFYEKVRGTAGRKSGVAGAAKVPAKKKQAAKKPAAKKPAKKKPAKKKKAAETPSKKTNKKKKKKKK